MGPARPGLGPARPAMHLRTPSSTRPSHNSPIERHPCQIPLSQITYEPGPGVPVALVFAKRLAAHAHTPSPDPFLVSHATRIVPSVPGRKRGLHGRRVDSRERGAGSREQEAGRALTRSESPRGSGVNIRLGLPLASAGWERVVAGPRRLAAHCGLLVVWREVDLLLKGGGEGRARKCIRQRREERREDVSGGKMSAAGREVLCGSSHRRCGFGMIQAGRALT